MNGGLLMKVLMIEHYLPGSVYSLELSKELCEHVELTLCTSRHFNGKGEDFNCRSIFETNIKSGKLGVLYYFVGFVRSALICWLYKYDIIHVQTFKKMKLEVFIYKIMKKITKKKLVYTAHNILPHEKDKGGKEVVMLKEWYNLCDRIIVHNEQSKKVLCGFSPKVEERVRVIPHGTYNLYNNCCVEKQHDFVNFLQFGMIRKYKGISLLIDAVSLVPTEIKEKIKVVIAGKQYKELDNTDYEKKINSLNLEKCIEFRPEHIQDAEVPDLFNNCDCCLFPYEEIYGSGALLMAYTFNKPVIASDIPAFIEETDNSATGILFRGGDANSLAGKIQQFVKMSDEEINVYKDNISNLKKNKYSWKISAIKLREVYEELL